MFDQDVIRAANPALGVFLDPETIFKEAEQARAVADRRKVRSAICAATSALPSAADMLCTPSVWNQGDEAIDEDIFRDGRPVYGGLDLSARLDLTAMVLAAEDDAKRIHLKPLAWTPEKTLLTRTQRDGAPYDAWHRQGMLKATPGLTIDYDYVLADIVEVTDGMNLASIAFDNWNINALAPGDGAARHRAAAGAVHPGLQELFAGDPRIRGGGDRRPADPWRPSGAALVRFQHGADPPAPARRNRTASRKSAAPMAGSIWRWRRSWRSAP